MQVIKVVYIITDLSTGGAQMMLYKLLSRMSRERFAPVVISLMDHGTIGDRIEALDVPVYALNLEQGKPTLAALWRLITLVGQLQPNLIQGWMYHGNLAAQISKIFSVKRIPIFWNIQGSVYSLVYEKKLTAAVIRASSYFSRMTASIIFVSHVAQSQHEALGYHSKNNCVIPNGVDTWQFTPWDAARLSVRAELGLPEDTLLIGMMARFHPQKDHSNFLQAAAIVASDYPNVHFLLSGCEVDRENQTLNQLIEKLGLFNQVALLGERQDMHRLTAALDIACLSSAYGEAFSLALGEAMACGVPCVVTDIGDSAWMVDSTGRVVPPRNPEALAKGWRELIELGRQERVNLGQAARARVIEHFSLDSVVAQYESLYESAIALKLN